MNNSNNSYFFEPLRNEKDTDIGNIIHKYGDSVKHISI